jgi:hypothetical protein
MKDMLGREFEVGQLVAYGGRAGSHGYMAVGKVYKINGDKVSVKPVASNSGHKTSWSEDDDKAVGLRLPGRAVILNPEHGGPPACTMDCQTKNDNGHGYWWHLQGCPRR